MSKVNFNDMLLDSEYGNTILPSACTHCQKFLLMASLASCHLSMFGKEFLYINKALLMKSFDSIFCMHAAIALDKIKASQMTA